RGPGSWRGTGRGMAGLRAADDAAFGEGAGVSTGVSRRHGGRPVPEPEVHRGNGAARGGAKAGLRRHHARARTTRAHLRRVTPTAWRGVVCTSVALSRRDSAGAAPRSAAEGAGEPAG